MIKSFKYRLYPTKTQADAIDQMLETHRRLYNNALAERKIAWEGHKSFITYRQQAAGYTSARKINEYYQKTNFSSCQRTLKRLDKAFKAFFRRLKSGDKKLGYPKFRARNRFESIEFTYSDGCKLTNNRLYIQHIGNIRIFLHRPINGIPKSLIIRRQAGRYYTSISCDTEPLSLASMRAVVGLDMGLKHLIVTSEGDFYPAPKYLRESEQEINRLNRELHRRKKGSNRRKETIRKLQRAHEHIANQRKDYAHKIAFSLVRDYDLIAVENLNIESMIKNHYVAKSIADASWSTFINILSSHAAEAGKKVVQVNANNTSQICSSCGEKVPKSLNVRVHNCPYCDLSLDRDINAARNILNRALEISGPDGAFRDGSRSNVSRVN